MNLIIDAQLSPYLAVWIEENFAVKTLSASFLGLHLAEDKAIFDYARKTEAIVMTKDEDFVQLLHRFGPPPKIIWVTCGNTSNERIKKLLQSKMQETLRLLETFDLVEISD